MKPHKKYQFIQIGANVGNTENDPVFKNVKNKHWTGILIEPNPKAFNQLIKNYSDFNHLSFEQLAISDKGSGNISLFVDNFFIDNNGNGEGTSQHASCNYNVIVHQLQHHPDELTTISCSCSTVKDIFNKYSIDYVVDYLFVDTEGFDAKIITSIDFYQTKFNYVQYEISHMTNQEAFDTHHYICNFGYKLTSNNGEDVIYQLT